MWVLDADLRFARVHVANMVDTMRVLDADLSFAMFHYVKIMWLLDADVSFVTS